MTAPVFALPGYPTIIMTDPLELALNPSSINLGSQSLTDIGGVFFINSGAIESTVVGGLAPYTYQWSALPGTPHISSPISPTDASSDFLIGYSGSGFRTALVRLEVTDSLGVSTIQTVDISIFIISESSGAFE